MRYKKILFILTTILISAFSGQVVLFAHGKEVDINGAQAYVNVISKKLSNNEIVRIEIINIPSRILTRTRITPEMLEKRFYYKLTISDIRGNTREKELVEALKSATVRPLSEMPDIRWGIIFYDANDRRAGAIYFDTAWRGRGAVAGIPISFKGDLFKWLDDHFSSCFR
jgi:hypothetical protein